MRVGAACSASRWLPCSVVAARVETARVGDGLDRLPQLVRDALARYDKAVLDIGGPQGLVPVGSLTGQLGDWEPTNVPPRLVIYATG